MNCIYLSVVSESLFFNCSHLHERYAFSRLWWMSVVLVGPREANYEGVPSRDWEESRDISKICAGTLVPGKPEV